MANPQTKEQNAPQAAPEVQAPVAAAVAPVKKKVMPLNQTRISEASYQRTTYFVTAPAGTKPEDLLDPAYWVHIASKLKQFDLVDVGVEDGTWYGSYLVINAARDWAKLAVLMHVDLKEASSNMPLTDSEKYKVAWKGPLAKHAVIRTEDGAMLKDGFTTQLEGWQWLDGHLKSLAA